MSTADIAVIGVTVVGLANAYWNWRVQMKVADRLRIVNPAKAPAEPKAEPAQAAEPDTTLIPGLERVV